MIVSSGFGHDPGASVDGLLGRVAEWQTRTVQVRVSVRTWGYNSPLAHTFPAICQRLRVLCPAHPLTNPRRNAAAMGAATSPPTPPPSTRTANATWPR